MATKMFVWTKIVVSRGVNKMLIKVGKNILPVAQTMAQCRYGKKTRE
jgi:hypothetical protein